MARGPLISLEALQRAAGGQAPKQQSKPPAGSGPRRIRFKDGREETVDADAVSSYQGAVDMGEAEWVKDSPKPAKQGGGSKSTPAKSAPTPARSERAARPRATPTFAELTGLQPTENERAAMETPGDRIQNPFDSGFTSSLRGSIEETSERTDAADQILDRVVSDSTRIRSELQAKLEATAEAKKNYNNEVRADFNEAMERIRPSQKRRMALADQLAKIERMNPLEQGIRSMFDPNFNRRALKAEIAQEAQVASIVAGVFDERYKETALLAQLAASDYEADEAVAEALLKNGGEDFRLAMQRIQLASMTTSNLLGTLGADSQLAAARQTAIDTTVSNLTLPQINAAIAEASKSADGTATVNGIPVPVGVLTDQQGALIERVQRRQFLEIAIEKGNEELVQIGKKDVLKTMSIPDIEKAIADGGNFDGVQFDVIELTERLAALQQSRAVVQAESDIASARGRLAPIIRELSSAESNRAVNQRFAGLMGVVPKTFMDNINYNGRALKQFIAGAEEAKRLGTERQYFAQQEPVLLKLLDERKKAISSAVTAWAGGNKDLEVVGTAWMTGQPITSESAIKAMISFARNGTPAGSQFSGESAAIFKIVREEVARDEQGSNGLGPNQSIESILAGGGKAPSKAEREQALVGRILTRAQQSYRAVVGKQITMAVPSIAKSKGLPFARIDANDWANAVRVGDAEGLRTTADRMGGASPEEFAQILREGESSAIWQKYKESLPPGQQSLGFWKSQLTADQMAATYAHLDANFSAPGFDPSLELRRVIESPEYIQNAQRGGAALANSTFGGFLASAVGNSSLMPDVQGSQELWLRTYVRYTQGRNQARAQQVSKLAADPIRRTDFILGTMNLPAAEEQAVMAAVQERFGSRISRDPLSEYGRARQGASGRTPPTAALNEEIDAFILSANTGNPELDKILKRIRKPYETLAGPITRGLSR